MKKTTEQFIIDATIVHGDKYDYSLVDYVNTKTKVNIICLHHGIFSQRPNDHLTGYGCAKCGKQRTASSLCLTTSQFIKKAQNKFNNKYDYSLTNYTSTHQYIKIICPIHGVFIQTPRQHLRGKTGGCLKCAGLLKNTQEFIKQSSIKHNNLYEYNNTNYLTALTPVIITCKIHGDFNQTPSVHLQGSGCQKCSLHQYSLKSIRWLEYLMTRDNIYIQHATNVGEYKIPTTKFKVDGYCAKTNTVYEFHGDVFHGNPNKFKPSDKCHPFDKSITAKYLLERTQKKEIKLYNMGYNLITMWESDWDLQENYAY